MSARAISQQREQHNPSADPSVNVYKSWVGVQMRTNGLQADPSRSIRRSICKNAQVVVARVISRQRDQQDPCRSIAIHPPIHP
jgi:hypothetical protein